jgi:hypothetical protein
VTPTNQQHLHWAMPSTITWTRLPFPSVIPDCASWTYLTPLELNYGQSHTGNPLAPVTLVQTCTSFSTSTQDPSLQSFTVSLQGSAWQTRTQTFPASIETWTSTFVRSYADEYSNAFFTGDATVVTEWLSSLDISTNAPRFAPPPRKWL